MEADFGRDFLETSNKILKTTRTEYVRLLFP